jgi:hypothetical protein
VCWAWHVVYAVQDHSGVPGAIAGKFTVSRITEKFLLMVVPIFISKNEAFEACCGT